VSYDKLKESGVDDCPAGYYCLAGTDSTDTTDM
jgi:hypothetical protein